MHFKKLLYYSLTLVLLFNSCSKSELVKPHAYLDLKVVGSNEEFIWEIVEGEWLIKNQSAKIYAMSDQGSQFSLNLANVSDTGNIASITIKEVTFTDALHFKPDKILSGYVRLKTKNDQHLEGEFDIELESVNYITEKRRIKGIFGVVN
jgi:hypothetical protein